MAEIVSYNPNVHLEDFRQMNIESMDWHCKEMREKYQIDIMSYERQTTVPEFIDDTIEPYLNLKPPEGIVYILEVDRNAAGMIAVWKLSENIGEIHMMWIRPEYRGNNYGKSLLKKILEAGRGLGYSTFRLATPKYAHTAQHIYRSAGFKEIEEYREISNPIFSEYWLCMEKKE
jgi:ribosomal protein S18 acetylase RimI-like enzyme